MALPDILYRGSVKNVRGTKGVTPYIFEFSDRYSVYDWGEMPDQLSGKGEALAFMAWFFFDHMGGAKGWQDFKAPAQFADSATLARLKQKGLPHHMIGLAGGDLKPLSLDREIMSPSKFLLVRPVNVIEPASETKDGKLTWDYSAYRDRPVQTLVPLEVIFRFGVPDGSSLLKRTGDAAYCKAIGLDKAPVAGDKFDLPVIELSTKLETKDRYLSYADAKEIAGLSDAELSKLIETAALVALRLKACFDDIGIELWDGKVEFGFAEGDEAARDFMLVDSIGPDELRLLKDGVHLSKEVLRTSYRGTNWLAAVEKAKTLADERGEKDWKKICIEELKCTPSLLSPVVKEKAGMIYKGISKALCEKYHGKAVFANAWDIAAVAASLDPKKKAVA